MRYLPARRSQTARPNPTAEVPIDWRQRAGCHGEDSELFFASSDSARSQEAKSICYGCPVIDQCLQWALTTKQDYGIWGGLDVAERRSLARSRCKQPAPAAPATAA